MAPKKAQTMSLADFSKSFGTDISSSDLNTTASSSLWADDVVLPSAPTGAERPSSSESRSMRGAGRDAGFTPAPVVIDQSALPRSPPYQAFVGNLSFNATEEDISQFFSQLSVQSVRFPAPNAQGPRGFAYVEFATVEDLTKALMMSGQDLAGRPVRIDLSTGKQRDDRSTGNVPRGNWRGGDHAVVERKDLGSWSDHSRSNSDFSSSSSRINALSTQLQMDQKRTQRTSNRSGDGHVMSRDGPRSHQPQQHQQRPPRREPPPPMRKITRATSDDLVVPLPPKRSESKSNTAGSKTFGSDRPKSGSAFSGSSNRPPRDNNCSTSIQSPSSGKLTGSFGKPRSSSSAAPNPFGAARPREENLAKHPTDNGDAAKSSPSDTSNH